MIRRRLRNLPVSPQFAVLSVAGIRPRAGDLGEQSFSDVAGQGSITYVASPHQQSPRDVKTAASGTPSVSRATLHQCASLPSWRALSPPIVVTNRTECHGDMLARLDIAMMDDVALARRQLRAHGARQRYGMPSKTLSAIAGAVGPPPRMRSISRRPSGMVTAQDPIAASLRTACRSALFRPTRASMCSARYAASRATPENRPDPQV
jgi:hypothetical protein